MRLKGNMSDKVEYALLTLNGDKDVYSFFRYKNGHKFWSSVYSVITDNTGKTITIAVIKNELASHPFLKQWEVA